MKSSTREQYKAFVEQWKRAGPILERFRREELRRWVYDWTSIDALLDMGDRFGRSRFPSGMVEMQRLFMKAARQQGLLPAAAVREKRAVYSTKKSTLRSQRPMTAQSTPPPKKHKPKA